MRKFAALFVVAAAFLAVPALAQSIGTLGTPFIQTPDTISFGELKYNMNFDEVDLGLQHVMSGAGSTANNGFVIDKSQAAGAVGNITDTTTLNGSQTITIEDSRVVNIEIIRSGGQSAFAFGHSKAANSVSITTEQL